MARETATSESGKPWHHRDLNSDESFKKSLAIVVAQVNADLVTGAVMLQRLLGAVDLFPLGGLYSGHYIEQAIRRYWLLWMPLLDKHGPTSREPLVPPLDVQWAWFVHRLHPLKYIEDCRARFGRVLHPVDFQQALGFSAGPPPPAPQRPRQGPDPGPIGSPAAVPRRSGVAGPAPTSAAQAAAAGTASYEGLRKRSPEELWQEGGARQLWEVTYPAGPNQSPEHVFWPPAPPKPTTTAAATSATTTAEIGTLGEQPDTAGAGVGGGVVGSGHLDNESDRSGDGALREAAAASAGLPPLGSIESVRQYVIEASARQSIFLNQMLRAPYQDPVFLAGARTRYLRFLALAASKPPASPMAVPMFDIDLMWHAHCSLSGVYAADCAVFMSSSEKRLLGHDDSLAEEALLKPFEATLERYEAVTGLMYNTAPTRRLPSHRAHPLAVPLWPLAFVLDDPRAAAAALPSAAEIAAAGSTAATGGAGASGLGAARGSHDHINRNATFALYALWCLSEGLSYGRCGRTEGVRVDAGPGGGGGPQLRRKVIAAPPQTDRRRPRGARRLSGLFAGLGCFGAGGMGGGGSGDSPAGVVPQLARAVVDAAVSHMTSRLLLLADPGATTSPLASWRHPFWEALLPLPPPGCEAGPSPPPTSLAATSTSTPTANGNASGNSNAGLDTRLHACSAPEGSTTMDAGGGGSAAAMIPPTTSLQHRSPAAAATATSSAGPCHSNCRSQRRSQKRHPGVHPNPDLPAATLPPSARDGRPMYLAPHHYASLTNHVLYTPADFCLLGPGRWCLPPRIAEEVLGREPSLLADEDGSGDDGGAVCGGDDGEYDTDTGYDDDMTNRMLRLNTLGLIVFGPDWRRRLERCCRQLYNDIRRRATVAADMQANVKAAAKAKATAIPRSSFKS